MKRLVEFPLDEGGSILVQVDEPESGGTVRRARPPQLPGLIQVVFLSAETTETTETLETLETSVVPQGHPVWGAGNPSPPNLAPPLRTR
jgi:hypothetical protein